MKKVFFVTAAAMIFLVVVGFTSESEACTRTGLQIDKRSDFCWNYSNPILPISGTVQLRFTDIGGGHHLCSGVINVTNPLVMGFPAYGNAELVGDDIYVTLSLAGIRNGVMGIDMIKAKLNPTTLNGTVEHVGVYSDAVEISNGTLTHTTCQ